jgi:hypothetical protein
MPANLTIHVIGSGFGETIVICLPNGKVGVIDCYSPDLALKNPEERATRNPIVRFLRTSLAVDRLAFLALTHPHEDHGRGLSHILSEYKDRIDEVWIFDAFQEKALDRYFSALFSGRRKLPIEQALNEEPGTFPSSINFSSFIVNNIFEIFNQTSLVDLRERFAWPQKRYLDRLAVNGESLLSRKDPQTRAAQTCFLCLLQYGKLDSQ